MAEALSPILAAMTKRATKPAAPVRPKPPPREEAVTLRALVGPVTPVAGTKRVSPVPQPTGDKLERNRRRTLLEAAPAAELRTFMLTREEGTVSAYRSDLGPGALSVLEMKRFRPSRELDLHGERMRGFETRLASALRQLHQERVTSVLLIHGKGLHSPRGESILFESVIEALTEGPAARLVRAFCTAPGRLGGSGALIVALDRGLL